MWPSNPLTERLKLKYPIILAPMGLITTPALAAAVSNAGGLGGIGMWGLTAEEAARRIAGFRQLSPGSLNVNYPLWPEPRYTAEASDAMRQHLQAHYDTKGIGAGATATRGGERCQPRACRRAGGTEAGSCQLSFRFARSGDCRRDQIRRHLHPVERDDGRGSAHAGAARRRCGHRPGQ